MMVDVRQNGEGEEAADGAAALARLADASAKLFAEQASAMAVMTAFGMSVAGQMTGFMLGAFQSAKSKAVEPETGTAPDKRGDGNVVSLRPQAQLAEAEADPAKPEIAAEGEPAPVEKQSKIAKVAAKPAARKPVVKPVAEAVVDKPAVKTIEAKPAVKVAPAKTPAAKPAVKAAEAKPAAKPAEALPVQDDLKKISGIGPRLEKVLNARGIFGYADIAGMSAAALKKIDAELDLDGRVTRDDWAGQAKALLAGRA